MSNDIRIRRKPGKWVVRASGAVLGETRDALELSEGSSPPVLYFPRGDLAMALFEPSATRTTCPKKGAASYYSIHAKSAVIEDACWSYETPLEAVAEIRGYLAFYPDKVTIEEI